MEDGLGLNQTPKNVEHHFLTNQFNKYCPILISMGMTYEQFWEGDPTMVKDYIEAFKVKQKREIEITKWAMWEQGLYVYEAICDVSPVLRAFSKSAKPLPYPKQPYGWEKSLEEDEETKKLKEERDKYRLQIFFQNWVNNMKKRNYNNTERR